MNAISIGSGSVNMPIIWANLAALTIGSNCQQNNQPGGTFNSVEVYARALTQTEIQQKMDKSYTGRTENGILPS